METLVAMGAKTVNIVPTIKFTALSKTEPISFCYQKNTCEAMTQELIVEIENKLLECSVIAAEAGVNLSFVPHLDDGEGKGLWRNNLVFDPLKKYQGFSYKEIILDPIKRIIQKVNHNNLSIDFAFQGEMGATVFHYPESYSSIYKDFKKVLSENVEVGISINFNDVGGRGFKYSRSQRKKVQRLLNRIDFLGMSAYHPVELEMQKHFSFSVDKFIHELKKEKLTLPLHTPIHFSEMGLGGGTRRNDGRTMAQNPQQLLAAPYAGIYGQSDQDNNPWVNTENSQVRLLFYKELIHFVNANEGKYNITRAFIWNSDSWDIFGIYPGTLGYADREIMNLVIDQ